MDKENKENKGAVTCLRCAWVDGATGECMRLGLPVGLCEPCERYREKKEENHADGR